MQCSILDFDRARLNIFSVAQTFFGLDNYASVRCHLLLFWDVLVRFPSSVPIKGYFYNGCFCWV